MMKKVVLSLTDPSSNNAGPKAKTDIDDFLSEEGFEIWRLNYDVKSKFKKIKYIYYDIPRLFRSKNVKEVIIQYPIYSNAIMDRIIKVIRQQTNAYIYLVVHDIETLRFYHNDSTYKIKELEWFNNVDGIIAHNNKMREWIVSKGITTPVVPLGIFDYKNPQPINDNKTFNKTICYAGNLKKSVFLKKIDFKNIKLKVFGPNPYEYTKNVEYCGQYSPEELPKYLNADFGLVWDGTSVKTCDGLTGNYLRYNSPHKLSLYLSSGLPVIVWKEAAMSELIEKENLGLSVEKLEELPQIFNGLTEENYRKMKADVLKFASSLRKGENIKKAIKKIEKY